MADRRVVAGVLGGLLVLALAAGCGVIKPPSSVSSSAVAGSPTPTAEPVPDGFVTLDASLLKGATTATLNAPEAHVVAKVPQLAGLTALNLAVQVVRDRELRAFAKAGGTDFASDWVPIAATNNLLGVLSTTKVTDKAGVAQTMPIAFYFDGTANQVYTSPALIEATHWDAFGTLLRTAIAASSTKIDPTKAAAALKEPSAAMGNGPAMGFTAKGDFVVAFASGIVNGTQDMVSVTIPSADIEPVLSSLGRRVRGGVTHPSPFDPASAKTGTAVTIPLVATGTRPSADVVPDCAKLQCVALTFDDGPAPRTQEVVNYFRDAGAAATFFQLGDMINSKEGPARVLATAASGMQIGSHTWRHKAMATEKVAVVTDQVSKNASALAAITGDQTIFMRPPYGSHNKASDAVAHDAGEVVALWSVDTLDWKTRNTQATIASASASKSGDVVLMHDIHDPTVAAVKQTIANLQSAGFTLVTMAELASPGDWTPGNTYCAAPARKMSCGSAQYTP